MQFSPLAGQVCHLKWLLAMCLHDHLDIFVMYSEVGNDVQTEMQLNLQDSPHPCVLVTTPKADAIGLSLTAAKYAVITQKFWVLNEQQQEFAQVIRLGQNSIPQPLVLNTGPNGSANKVSDFQQHSGVAQMSVLHSLMSRPNITTTMIYQILECRQDNTTQLTEHVDFLLSDGGDE
jgi:hypothetical protein